MKTILVIEDESSVRMNIAELLEMEGYRVLIAENGRIGVEIAETNIPDLIICDINMPELNGYETLAVLRSNPRTAIIPFIFLTARTEMSDLRDGMQLGADDYLAKPFDINTLQQTIEARLSRHGALNDSLEFRMQELRNNISSAVPHELRTPLISILGFSKMLSEGGNSFDAEKIKEMGEHIYLAASSLHRQIENYIYYVQLEMLLSSPDKLEILRKSIISDASDTIYATAISKADLINRRTDILCNLEDAPLRISAEHFSKIIAELTDNALKFSDPGTRYNSIR